MSRSAAATPRLYRLLASFRLRYGWVRSVTHKRLHRGHTAELAGRMRAEAVLPAATARLSGALMDSRWLDARACLFTLCTLFTVRGHAVLAQQCDSLASLLMVPLAWRSQSLHFPGALLRPPCVRMGLPGTWDDDTQLRRESTKRSLLRRVWAVPTVKVEEPLRPHRRCRAWTPRVYADCRFGRMQRRRGRCRWAASMRWGCWYT